MASQIDTVRKLHAPSLVKVPDTFDVDVICEHCTTLIRATVEKIDTSLAEKIANIEYPCDTALSAGATEASARAEVEKIRGAHFDAREAELREELDYIETVRALVDGDADEVDEVETPAEPEPEEKPAEPEPEVKKPVRKAPAKKAPAKKAEPKVEEKPAEPEAPADEPVSDEAPVTDEQSPADEDDNNDWDF